MSASIHVLTSGLARLGTSLPIPEYTEGVDILLCVIMKNKQQTDNLIFDKD
jgi:hypothetical protein